MERGGTSMNSRNLLDAWQLRVNSRIAMLRLWFYHSQQQKKEEL